MIINFGSLNIDHVYRVDHFVRPGETIASRSYQQFAGGKGFNQSIALARAGAQVRHAGKIGAEGGWLLDVLREAGATTEDVSQVEIPTGHALIQVDTSGENAIILYGGANQSISAEDVERVLAHAAPGDYLLLQNEINNMDRILRRGAQRGMRIVFNPAPMTEAVLDYPLEGVAIFIVNETEAEALTGASTPDAIVGAMRRRFPKAATVLTLGAAGAIYADSAAQIHVPAVEIQAVDTTAAGDTFTGYFLAALAADENVEDALQLAARAAAICVTRPGAADSIPMRAEVLS
ncbi:MAG: ribokinase [Caldilineaceae bacterium]|nr:ribokinase [Caldilineaceae bacterium]